MSPPRRAHNDDWLPGSRRVRGARPRGHCRGSATSCWSTSPRAGRTPPRRTPSWLSGGCSPGWWAPTAAERAPHDGRAEAEAKARARRSRRFVGASLTSPPMTGAALRVALVGIGLIVGSSRRRAPRRPRRRSSRPPRSAVDRGAAVSAWRLVDQATTDLAAAVRGADLVPLHAGGRLRRGGRRDRARSDARRDRLRRGLGEGPVMPQMQPHLRPACISCRPTRSPARSIPAPMPASRRCSSGRWCILTPPEDTTPPRRSASPSGRRWGADVERMTPSHHDLVLAITSHLPHLIAYTSSAPRPTSGHHTARSSSSPPAASATSPASRPPTRRCGATCS